MDRRIDAGALRACMERIFEKEGFSPEDARAIADVLMQADLFGIESHGAQRLRQNGAHSASAASGASAHARPCMRPPSAPSGHSMSGVSAANTSA